MCRLGLGWDQSTVCIWQGSKTVQDVQWSYRLENSLTLFQIPRNKLLQRSHLGLFGWSWHLPRGYSWLKLVSAVTLTHVEFKALNDLVFKTKISPSREIAGVIITMSWVWLIFRQLNQWEFVDVWKHSELDKSQNRRRTLKSTANWQSSSWQLFTYQTSWGQA